MTHSTHEFQPDAYQKPRKHRFAAAIGALMIIGFGAPAHAGSTEALAVFYVSLKGIQLAALSGTADMWAALGSAEKSQECLGLAKDLDKGDLANENGMKKYKAQTADLRQTIDELQETGVPLSKDQHAAAQKGYLKIAGTAVLWVAAGVSAVKIAQADDLKPMEKFLVLATMTGEVASAGRATADLVSAWRAYRSMNVMGNLKAPSKELAAQFVTL